MSDTFARIDTKTHVPDRWDTNNKEGSVMLSKLDRFAHSPLYNVVVGVLFAAFAVLGYIYGGESFLTQWVGGVAAALAIASLIFKTQGYWFWSIVNAVLWFILFKHMGLPMLAGLQVSYILFSIYGVWQWASVKFRIGYDKNVWTDNLGTVVSLLIFLYTVVAYMGFPDFTLWFVTFNGFSGMPGYAFTGWWCVEFLGVFISIVANWMDVFKYKTNWIGWTMTNLLFAPLFFHGHLWGPFVLTFLYQAFCIIGFINWYRDEKRLVREGKVTLVGGAQVA